MGNENGGNNNTKFNGKNFNNNDNGDKNKYYKKNNFKKNNNRKQFSNYKPIRKQDETVEDIKTDIARIEKEIDLEIKEIMSLRLGM